MQMIQAISYFEIVWTHKNVRDAFAHDTKNPFVEISWCIFGNRVGHFGFNQTIDATDLQIKR